MPLISKEPETKLITTCRKCGKEFVTIFDFETTILCQECTIKYNDWLKKQEKL